MTFSTKIAKQDGRNLVRIPLDKMKTLGVVAGDTVAIAAERLTHARVMPAATHSDDVSITEELLSNVKGTWETTVEVHPAHLHPLNTAVIKIDGTAQCSVQDLSEALFDLPLTQGDVLSVKLPPGRAVSIEVMGLDPVHAGLFRETTTLSLAQRMPPALDYNQIGGLDEQITRVHEMVAAPLLRPDLFARLGVPSPRGVLFTGPPGSGKTLLARGIAAKTSAAFYQISGPEIVSKHYGESEAALRKIFEAAQKDAPAIIFIDEIDAIAPRRDGLSGEKQVERRVVAQLLTLMDGLSERGQVILMAATNLPDSLDPALRRPGRFDREIGFDPPTAAQRAEILSVHLRDAPLSPDVDIDAIAQDCHGYVGADLAALSREAALAALDRSVTQAGGEDRVDIEELFILQTDLRHGLAATGPSILRDTHVETPTVTFADVGGMQQTKDALIEAIIWPQQHKAAFARLKLGPVSGVLMSGPPGSGKTLLARALACESGMNFIPVRPGKVMSQFLGNAEREISEIFNKARQSAPCIIFFDELDALAPRRAGKDAVLDRIVAQLLTEMDGLAANNDVVVLAATNRAEAIDPAVTRPGRFDMTIPIPLPDTVTRQAIIEVHSAHLPLSDDVDLTHLANQTERASGATLAAIVRSAARIALRRTLRGSQADAVLEAADFEEALALAHISETSRHHDFIGKGAA